MSAHQALPILRQTSDDYASASPVAGDAPDVFERAQYVRTLGGRSSWLGFQAYLKTHAEGSNRS